MPVVRRRSEPGALPEMTVAALGDLRTGFERLTPPPAIRMPWWDWSLSFDNYLLTRVMEIVVHAEDLAVSVDVEPPAMPEPMLGPVLAVLVGVSLRRHGQAAVVRARSRAASEPAASRSF